jgi:hypothetical protein
MSCKMDQRSMYIFLIRQGSWVSAIHEWLVIILVLDTIACSATIKHVRETRWTVGKNDSLEKESSHFADHTILSPLHEQPFSSVRDLTKRTWILPFTSDRRLMNFINLIVNYLYWILYEVNGPIVWQGINVKLAPENCTPGSVSRVAIYLDPWWVLVLSIDKSWNSRVAEERSIVGKGKIYDSGKKNDDNRLEFLDFEVLDAFPKAQTFDAACYFLPNWPSSSILSRFDSSIFFSIV